MELKWVRVKLLGKKLKLHLTLTQMKNEKPKNAAGSRLVPSLCLSDNIC